MKKNRISKNWINKQKRDIYVRQSQVDGYRARSAYKLIEIDEKFKILKNGISVIDLGASPGSWSQYISRTVKSGRLVSIDIKGMEEIENTIQIKGDFTDLDSQKKSPYLKILQIIKLSLDSFLLDLGLKTFTSLNNFLPKATISLNDEPRKILETNRPSLTNISLEKFIASIASSPV